MTQTLLERLRQATHSTHMALHEHPLMTQHVLRGLSPQSYGLFLRAFLAPWRSVQPWRSSFEQWPMDDLTMLEADLQALSQGVWTDQATPLTSADAATGALYTLFGSSMGGRGILKVVRQQWPDAPSMYLSQADGVSRWGQFALWLKQQPYSCAHEETLQGAQQCFELVQSGFDHALQHLDAVQPQA